jgi:hypothetical protein
VLAAALLLCLLACPAADAAPGWLAPVDMSQPGRNASNPVVAMGEGGDTALLWERQSVASFNINLQLATRQPRAGFGAPADFSLGSTIPALAMTPGGEAVAAWRHFANPPGSYVIEVASSPPGGGFSAPVPIAEFPQGALPSAIDVAVNPAGATVVSWQRFDPESGFGKLVCEPEPKVPEPCPNPPFVEAAVRPAGGTFSAPVRVSPPRGEPQLGETKEEKEKREIEESARGAFEPRVAIDAAGEAALVWTYFDGERDVTQQAIRPPGGAFSSPQELSEPGETAAEPDVAMDSTGVTDAIWTAFDGTNQKIEASTRPAGGAFSAPAVLSSAGESASNPSVGMGAGGAGTAIWSATEEGIRSIEVSRQAPGGGFGEHTLLSREGRNAFFSDLAVNSAGGAVATWAGFLASGEYVVEASYAGPSGAFAPPKVISEGSPDFLHPRAAIDGSGDGTVTWTRSNGTNTIVQAAGLDAYVPELRSLAIPTSGKAGVPVSFSVDPFDVWPLPGPASFAFGDGAVAAGNSTSHTYATAGHYQVTVTAQDSAGTPVSATGTIAIAPSNDFKIGKLKLDRKKGTGKLAVTVPGPGEVVLSGKGVAKARKRAVRAGTVQLPVKAVGKLAKRLKSKGKAKLPATVTFTPEGGSSSAQRRGLTLVEKHS